MTSSLSYVLKFTQNPSPKIQEVFSPNGPQKGTPVSYYDSPIPDEHDFPTTC